MVSRVARQPRHSFDSTLRQFLARLHRHLATHGRCFVSGSFVMEMPPGARFQVFLDNLLAHSSRRLLAKTHDDFQNPAKLASHRLCATACGADARALRAGAQHEYRFRPPLAGLCGSQDAYPKGVLLWYTFSLGLKRYVFMKLETHASTSPAHATSALSRYVLKKKKKTPFETRREDAYKDSKRPIREAAAAAAARNVAALWPAHAREATAYDASVRTGMELFVPAAIVATLI